MENENVKEPQTKVKKKAVNNISDELMKNYKIVNNFSWRLVFFAMFVTFLIVVFIIFYDAYTIKSNQLKVEANNINNEINDEFSVVVNAINMNGYITAFEQYLKTSEGDEEEDKSLYYENASKTLNNMGLISEEIQNVFVASFRNKSVLYSGIGNVYKENFSYENEPWYNYKEIMKNNAYISDEYTIDGYESEKYFGIVRPILDSMSDEPLGVLVFSFSKDYLGEVFTGSTMKNQSESVIRIDDGKILYTTQSINANDEQKLFLEEYLANEGNIVYRLENENLNWSIVTYCGLVDIISNSFAQFIVVIAVFILLFLTFNIFVKKLKFIRVVRTNREIKEIIDLNKIQEQDDDIEESLEEVDLDDFIEMPIEEVLDKDE